MTCWTYRTKYKASFIAMIALTVVLFLSKIIIGYKQNSLSLISSSFHLTSDLAALVIGYSALRFAEQRADRKYTFGVVRAEILGATVNAIFLIAICFSLSIESLERLVFPDLIEDPKPVLIVGTIALVINAIGLFLFRCKKCRSSKQVPQYATSFKKFSTDLRREVPSPTCSGPGTVSTTVASVKQSTTRLSYQLNIHAVFLHILQHIFVTLVVILSALIIMFAKGQWTAYVDPVLSLVVVFFILKSSVPLLTECLMIFMQTAPANLQLERLKEKLSIRVPEIVGVHELHIWQLAGDEVVGSVHIVFRSHKKCNQKSMTKIKEFFIQEGISSITVQPEFSDALEQHSEHKLPGNGDEYSEDCLLLCAQGKCAHSTCCETTEKLLLKLTEH